MKNESVRSLIGLVLQYEKKDIHESGKDPSSAAGSSPANVTTKKTCMRRGKEAELDPAMPITLRRYFIEGSGQLCKDCLESVYQLHRGIQNGGTYLVRNNPPTAD